MAIGWIVFALIFGSVMLAMALHAVVPEHHLGADSKDVVKLGIAVIATMSALVISLLLASAKASYDTRSREFTQMSANIIVLDRLLAQQPQPGFVAVAVTLPDAGRRPMPGPIQAPFERAHHAVGSARTQALLPGVHPSAVNFRHL